nr:hypothetical protein BaRGS_027463 [Batillaria attramentaria]
MNGLAVWRQLYQAQKDWEPDFLQDFEEAADILEERRHVVLCGHPGSGKTALGYALLRQYRSKGHKIYVLLNVKDWVKYISEGRRSVVLMDGTLGEVRVERAEYKHWRDIARSVLELNKSEDCLLVLTVYPHILRELHVLDAATDSPLLDSMAVVHLMKHPLDEELKRGMLTVHLKDLHLDTAEQDALVTEILQNDVSGAAFPWCCRQMAKMLQSAAADISGDNETTPLFQKKIDYTNIFSAPSEAHIALLQRMLRDPEHKETVAVILSLTMQGLDRFLHYPGRAQAEMQTLGFRDLSDYRLEEYADVLKSSILNEVGDGFYSRAIYNAVGFALGRSFSLPILLKVCDVMFLVQHVHTKETATHASVTIGPSPDDRQLLMQTMFTHLCITHDYRSIRNQLITHVQSRNICLRGQKLPIPEKLIKVMLITEDEGDKVRVVVSNKRWYLAHRLLTDTEVDERDEEGNTLLHVAADVGDVDAVTIAVKILALTWFKRGVTP